LLVIRLCDLLIWCLGALVWGSAGLEVGGPGSPLRYGRDDRVGGSVWGSVGSEVGGPGSSLRYGRDDRVGGSVWGSAGLEVGGPGSSLRYGRDDRVGGSVWGSAGLEVGDPGSPLRGACPGLDPGAGTTSSADTASTGFLLVQELLSEALCVRRCVQQAGLKK